jgi:hypothetical protein
VPDGVDFHGVLVLVDAVDDPVGPAPGGVVAVEGFRIKVSPLASPHPWRLAYRERARHVVRYLAPAEAKLAP